MHSAKSSNYLVQVLILIDGEEKKSASMREDFTPAIQPEEEIDDPEDKKPADWVDVAKIPDPEAAKPEDWDEDAPLEIPDEVRSFWRTDLHEKGRIAMDSFLLSQPPGLASLRRQ